MSWGYLAAVEAVVAAARREDPRRRLKVCGCGSRFLTTSAAPDAAECGYCWRRWRREAQEEEDRAAFARYLDGGGDPLDLGLPKSEPQLETAMQGVLF